MAASVPAVASMGHRNPHHIVGRGSQVGDRQGIRYGWNLVSPSSQHSWGTAIIRWRVAGSRIKYSIPCRDRAALGAAPAEMLLLDLLIRVHEWFLAFSYGGLFGEPTSQPRFRGPTPRAWGASIGRESELSPLHLDAMKQGSFGGAHPQIGSCFILECELTSWCRGGRILVDETGLGKTIQVRGTPGDRVLRSGGEIVCLCVCRSWLPWRATRRPP